MSGRLVVVGVGPGDPELVTVRAARLIGEARTIVFFARRGGDGHARRIAQAYMRPGTEEIRLEYPFTTEIPRAEPAYGRGIDDFHDTAASGLALRRAAGEAPVLLCEGDPFFYGSSMHLFDRLAGDFAVEVVPGISAMSAAWSQVARPIARGDERLTVLPGTLDENALADALSRADAAVIMKIGRNLPQVRRALERAGVLGRAIYVEHASAPGATSMPLALRDETLGAPYFSLVLVPGLRGAR